MPTEKLELPALRHTQTQRPPILSLFCGPGGLDEGFWQAGYQTALGGDIDAAAVKTHSWNHSPRGTFSTQLDVAKLDVKTLVELWRQHSHEAPKGVIGGPPCQSFSQSNRFKRDNDPRHDLPEHYARLIKELNRVYALDFFLFENVPGLLSEKHRVHYEGFKNLCRGAGFHVSEQLIDAAHFGVPQHRRRIMIVGINERKFPDARFQFPVGLSPDVPVRVAIAGLPEPIYFRRGLKPGDIPFHPNHWCMTPRSDKFANGSIKAGEAKSRCFRAISWDKPSWTVAYGHREVHVHPGCHRRLSVYEAMRLQGFPEQYELKGTLSEQITQVSDAVSPPVAKAMAEAIGQCLGYELGVRFRNIQAKEVSTWK